MPGLRPRREATNAAFWGPAVITWIHWLGHILKDIHIPDEVLANLRSSLLEDKSAQESAHKQQQERLSERLALVRRRLEQIYLDKLDGKVSEELWLRKSAEWQQEEQQVLMAMQGLSHARPDCLLGGVRILELANEAHFLYPKRPPAEKTKLLKMVLSNCALDAASIYPTYRKLFDLIFKRAQDEEWRAWRDSNETHLKSSLPPTISMEISSVAH